jgi:putative membrane protein
LVGVVAIPLAYSLFYLGAFWDPYSRLNDLPVAVVNNDSGAEINGESRNLGNELVNRLKTDDSLKWVITSQNDGKAGVDGNKYYAMITIPSDFSGSIASAETSDKSTALVTYEVNDKRNFLASQIFHSAILNLELELRSDVNRELTQELVAKFSKYPITLTT